MEFKLQNNEPFQVSGTINNTEKSINVLDLKTSEITNDNNYVTLDYVNSHNVQSDWNETDSTSNSYILNKPIIPNGLPAVSSTDNGKILQVVNGEWALVSPSTIYSGSGTPNNAQGNNGDLYMQI